jgi:predicted NBD/HSP70 family sugar kinase
MTNDGRRTGDDPRTNVDGPSGLGEGVHGYLPPVLSPARMGDVNRSRVLQALCDIGPLPRADLARLVGVPRATISGIVRPLLESGLLEEGPPDRSATRVGKPGRPLWFRRGAGLSASVVLHGHGCEAALVTAGGEILNQARTTLSDPTSAEAVQDDVGGLLQDALAGHDDVLGIGIAIPGVCDTLNGVVVGSSQVPGLQGHALGPALAEKLGRPVLIDNDSRAQALGEKWFGEGRGYRHFAALQTGHGLGVGLVIGGQVFRGEGGRVGEIGHVPLVLNGEVCDCGLIGCWETIATYRWMRAQAREMGLPNPDAMDAATLTRLGSADAMRILEQYAANLATGLAMIVQVLDPRRIILHGDVVGGGDALLAMIQSETRKRCLPHLRDSLDIVLSSLDQRAGLLGAPLV